MAKELEGLEEGPKAEIHIDLLRTTLKKHQIGKRQAMMAYMDSSSRNSPSFLALEMNRCLQETDVLKWMTKEKTTLIQKKQSKETPQTTTDP